jgi:four helix bundle protein
MNKRYSFEKLEIWDLALDLLKTIYHLARKLPKDESFGLAGQMKRAVISIALNIAEGRAADSDAEFRRYLGISLKSLVEVIGCIKICLFLNFIKEKEAKDILLLCDKIEAKIRSFRKTLLDS